MKKLLKVIASVVGIVVLLAILAAILLVTFVSPNRFKPLITEQVKKTTGRQLTIDGDLSWSFFPVIGVKVGHATLYNLPQFSQKVFAEIDHATVAVKLLPLLSSQIESSGVVLKGMKLNLIKNADGKTNWEDLTKKTSAPSVPVTPKSSEELGGAAVGLVVSALDISNSSVTWDDKQAKNYFDVDNFELHAKDINLKNAFPFSTQFNVASKNPALAGQISLKSEILLNVDNQIFQLNDTDLKANLNNVDIRIRGNIEANMAKQTLLLNDFTGQIANMSVFGKMNVTDFISQPVAKGKVEIKPVDFKAWLQAVGQKADNLLEMKNLSGTMSFTASSAKNINAQGRLSVDTLQAAKIKMTDVNVEIKFQNSVLQLSPVTAKLYQGDLYGQAKVDLNGVMPLLSMQAKLSDIQAEPLLQDLGGESDKIKFSGKGNVDLKMISAGKDADTILKNLSGSGSLNFADGELKGVDLGYMVDSAVALAKQQPVASSDTKKTSFGSLTGTIVIQNGVVTNNDLHFDAPRFDSTGKGDINLVSQTIDYSLQTKVKKISADRKDNLLDLYGMSIPIRITGSLSDPKVGLDTNDLLRQIAMHQIEKAKSNVQEDVKNKIQDQIKDNAGKLLNNFLGN